MLRGAASVWNVGTIGYLMGRGWKRRERLEDAGVRGFWVSGEMREWSDKRKANS